MESHIYNKKVACFIHSSNMEIWGTEILENFINQLKNANFFDLVDFIFINNLGKKIDENMFQHISNKIIVQNYSEDTKEFEKVTLKIIHSFSKINPDYKFLYIHTKGCSHEKIEMHDGNNLMTHIETWVQFMMYCLVENASSCIELLNNNDCVGCQLLYPDTAIKVYPKHYSGNFWWTNASYFSTIDCVEHLNTYYDAEWYMFKNNPNYINIYTYPIKNLFREVFHPEKYIDVVKKNLIYYKENSNFMKSKIDFVKVGLKSDDLYNGLSSQFVPIVNAIVDKIILKTHHNPQVNNILFLSSFCKDKTNDIFCSIKEILHLKNINYYLKKYNIILIPEEDAQITITKVNYGILGENIVNVTEQLKKSALKEKCLLIDNNIVFSNFCDDPIPNVKKILYITYNINGFLFQKNLKERLCVSMETFCVDLNKSDDKYNTSYSDTLLKTNETELINEIFDILLAGLL